MNNTIIELNNLSKRYRIGLKEQLHDTLTGALTSWIKSPFTNFQRIRKLSKFDDNKITSDIIWALKDISFKISRGEIVGVIGRNGAGKSTLLKILCRITEPTSGSAYINGRVASLLEVGTGFHPELTGRENVFLNGAILGMKKDEIKMKFDEIVAFSEVEQFIDTPVKRYSSGMRVRLAFAVAANLEPEILLIDEVLAVGDIQFQRKCLGKMENVASQGRTVLFVSHNMQTIRDLCPRSILLNNGKVVYDSSSSNTISAYNNLLSSTNITATSFVENSGDRRGNGFVRFDSITMIDRDGKNCYTFFEGQCIRFHLKYKVFKNIDNLYVSVVIKSGRSSEPIASTGKLLISDSMLKSGGYGKVNIEFSKPVLAAGEYRLYYWLGTQLGRPYDVVDNLTEPLIILSKEATSISNDIPKDKVVVNMESKISII